ncbi:hypothetical protein B7486_73660, partial [cyanobacterium TDX16]
MLGADPSTLAGASVGRDVVKRVWRFARPYRAMLSWFLLTIVVAAVINLAPPLLIRRIIDDALPQKDSTALSVLAGLMVAAAFADAALALLGRWYSARIGEGLIFDLR